jgi:hypothetical protein
VSTVTKIIARARQNYLLDQFRAATTAFSSDLITLVTKAWTTYLCKQVAEGVPDGQKPLDGQEQAAWKMILERVKDAAWKTDCMKRDEKFDMRFTAAVSVRFLGVMQSADWHSLTVPPADRTEPTWHSKWHRCDFDLALRHQLMLTSSSTIPETSSPRT